MTELRYIETEDQWEALPIGTLARVGYIEHDDDGADVDEGKKMTILRVEGDVRTNVGDYMLAGGKYWSEVWVWENGAYAVDTATIQDEEEPAAPQPSTREDAEAAVEAAIAAHREHLARIAAMPLKEYWNRSEEDRLVPDSPAARIVDAITDLGWAPPTVYPEGVQVWTISGIPDGGRSDGTQAYLSLPSRKDEHRHDFQDRSDIWLREPTVTVNFEVPRKRL